MNPNFFFDFLGPTTAFPLEIPGGPPNPPVRSLRISCKVHRVEYPMTENGSFYILDAESQRHFAERKFLALGKFLRLR